MEPNLSAANLMSANGSFGGFDLQGPIRVHHHQQHPLALHHHRSSIPGSGSSMVNPTIQEKFPLAVVNRQDCEQSLSLADYNKLNRGRSASDDDETILTEDALEGRSDLSKEKKASTWHRVKWTDSMVRLLITAVSYISEETGAEYGGGGRRKCANLQKKGKWKSVSKVMAERGQFVSPQQCEDKFNDLNKRYKRLNEILGRGTSCEVVENPALLDVMDHISAKLKEEVRKILSSKHLHYEEMCSYHNGNRLHLPPDPELQRSLRLALRSRDNHEENDMKMNPHDDNDEGDEEAEYDDRGEPIENQAHGLFAKRIKTSHSNEEFSFGNSVSSFDCNKIFKFPSENADLEATQALAEGPKVNTSLKQRSLQLEEQRLDIQVQMLELEKERFKWERFCKKKDRELEMMKIENERMKLENDHMALELRQKEMGIDTN